MAKIRKNKGTYAYFDNNAKVEHSYSWEFETDPLSWSQAVKDRFIYCGLTYLVKRLIAGKLDLELVELKESRKFMVQVDAFAKTDPDGAKRFLDFVKSQGKQVVVSLSDNFKLSEADFSSAEDSSDDVEKTDEGKMPDSVLESTTEPSRAQETATIETSKPKGGRK